MKPDYTGWIGSRSCSRWRYSGTSVGVEFPRVEVPLQVFAGGLDQPWVGADLLYLKGRGVAAHVLLLYHVAQVRPLTQTVDDVFSDLLLPLGRLTCAEQPLPEGSPFVLWHASLLNASIVQHGSLTSCGFPVKASAWRSRQSSLSSDRRYTRTRDSAIWTAFVAAPFSRLSATHQYWIIRPSTRTRPTKVPSFPAISSGVGKSSDTSTPG